MQVADILAAKLVLRSVATACCDTPSRAAFARSTCAISRSVGASTVSSTSMMSGVALKIRRTSWAARIWPG